MRPDELLDDILSPFEMMLFRITRQVNKRLTGYLAGLSTEAGRLKLDQKNIETATMLASNLIEDMSAAGFDDFVRDYTSSLTDNIKKLKSSVKIAHDWNFTRSDINLFRAMQQFDIQRLEQLSNMAAEAIQETVYNAILTGEPYGDLVSTVMDRFDNRFRRYANTYIETSRRQVMQKAMDISDDNNNVTERFYSYEGPRDDKTRYECNMALDKEYFTEEERSQFEADYGTRWNCRHIFLSIPKMEYEERV